MTENGKNQIRTIGSAMMGFVLVVGVGALALMSRGGSSKAPPAASHPSAIPAAPAGEPALPASVPAAAGVIGASSPEPVSPAVMAGSAQKAASPAPAPQTDAPPKPAALVVTQHLEATQTTSAKAEVAAAPAAKKMDPLPTRAREFVAPKLSATRNAGIASSVHYGVSSRSELMGRAAGPVYNFKGRGAKKADASAGKIGGQAATQIQEAQNQLEGSSLDEKAKKDLREKFQLVNDGVGKNGAN